MFSVKFAFFLPLRRPSLPFTHTFTFNLTTFFLLPLIKLPFPVTLLSLTIFDADGSLGQLQSTDEKEGSCTVLLTSSHPNMARTF
jgi:hypothetical protein